ncbi:MAG: ABC transporter substrate-binding protein [Planctomycetaceae bacterium]|nr:ABC transporter substrate-binding protein [Planctomycetaceae bacterium]
MKTRRWILIAVVAGAFGGSYALKRGTAVPAATAPSTPKPASRVVSLAPSITEVLFALGLGDRVVGVTRYCEFPPEARSKPIVGGYYDPNYEAIVRARPDLVATLPEHDDLQPELRKLGFPGVTVDHRSVRGILESLSTLSACCGAPEKGTALRASLEARIRRVGERTSGLSRPRVLVSIGRMAGDGTMTRITGCGPGGFFDELINLAGGVNALEPGIDFPAFSPEGLLKVDPDVIVDLWPDLHQTKLDGDAIRRLWKALPGVRARIEVIGETYALVPGPRVVLLLEDFARALHPEVPHD